MSHTVIDPLAPQVHPPKGRAVRLSERLNRGAHWAHGELLTLARPAPAEAPRPKSNLILTGAALTASAAGIALLSGVALRPLPNRVDIAATRLLQRRHSRVVTRAMLLISAPGFAPLQHVLTVGTAIDMWALGCRREALATIMTMGAGAITGVIKIAVGRPRPDPTYMRAVFQFRDNSFPSGHCAHYASFYGFMFYLAHRCMKPSSLRTAIMAGCAGIVTLVAPSRVYLGHHWSSDVVAGELVGLTYLFALIKAYEEIGVSL